MTVEIGADDVGGLIGRDRLDRMQRHDPDQVQRALHAFLDQTLAGVVSHGWRTGSFGPIGRMQKPLTPAGWTCVEEALAAASFWTLDPIEEFRPMFDGSDWRIRGRQGGRSHCIKRRSVYGPIRDRGELFIELAGSEAINEYFEYPATFPIRS